MLTSGTSDCDITVETWASIGHLQLSAFFCSAGFVPDTSMGNLWIYLEDGWRLEVLHWDFWEKWK